MKEPKAQRIPLGFHILANFFTIAYTLRMRAFAGSGGQAGDGDGERARAGGNLGALDLTFYNALLSLPLLVICRFVGKKKLWESLGSVPRCG